jgi:hypothetical protein
MNKHSFTTLAALAIALCCQNAEAAPLLSVQLPGNVNNYTTTIGSFFDAEIYIDDIPDLGGFDFSLTYDSSKLSAVSFTSASVFGAANTETIDKTLLPGTARLSEAISASSSLTQGLAITTPTLLATLHFRALDLVVDSPLEFFVDANTPIWSTFDGFSVAGSVQGAFVSIDDAAAAVPLPSTILLFAPGAMALFSVKKAKANKRPL